MGNFQLKSLAEDQIIYTLFNCYCHSCLKIQRNNCNIKSKTTFLCFLNFFFSPVLILLTFLKIKKRRLKSKIIEAKLAISQISKSLFVNRCSESLNFTLIFFKYLVNSRRIDIFEGQQFTAFFRYIRKIHFLY